jgi:predicted Rossmann fold nucleotide-binding protein DprA/Smf involved in DNA uptake
MREGAGSISDVQVIGNAALLDCRSIALICSVKCPGSVILQTYELVKAIRVESVAVISGFHSPMERECLNILLRGTCGIVVCPARSLPKRIPAAYRLALKGGRMLMLSPFDKKQTRATRETSAERNRLVASLADVVFVPYAAEGGKTEALCREIIAAGSRVLTFAGEHSANLRSLGAECVGSDGMALLNKE